jgi:membrane protein YdbS with pleckstrin-like domain
MMEQNATMRKRLRQAGSLIVGALLVQAASLWWNHPLSFLLFVAAACVMSLGMVIYLFAILSAGRQQQGALNEDENEIRENAGVP